VLGESSNPEDVALALGAVSRVDSYSSSEQELVCPWVTARFGDPRPEVRAAAGPAVAKCGPKSLKQAIRVLDELGPKGEIVEGQLSAFAEFCAAMPPPGERSGPPKPGDDALCSEIRNVLETAVGVPSLRLGVRLEAIRILTKSRIWQDAALGELLQHFAKSPEEPEPLRELARDALAFLGREAAGRLVRATDGSRSDAPPQ
jgi:hypothetical protein